MKRNEFALILLVFAVGGCRTAERTMLGLSRLKSPATVATPGINKPYTRAELVQSRIDPETLKPLAEPAEPATHTGKAYFDDYTSLRGRDTAIMVCLSGGGARAARMAAHTLARLEEKYNQTYPQTATTNPLAKRIDAWSSVSGGSVYASFVAVELQDRGSSTNTFDRVAVRSRARYGTQKLGGMASLYYLWPGNLGYAPMMQAFTEWDTLDFFAHNLGLFHDGGVPIFPVHRLRNLGDLPPQPRFFFNATCRETSRPLIFTQSVVHRDISGDPLARLTQDPLLRWIAGQTNSPDEWDEPFRHASTLEDLGSPPQRFPLAYAAMASAAFPGVFEPLPLHRYGFTNSSATLAKDRTIWWHQSEVTAVDGGLYDNTGLVTVLQLFDYLRYGTNAASDEPPSQRATGPKKLIVLAIDANNEIEGYTGPNRPSRVPWRFGLPFRGALSAVETVAKMYNNQQALVMAAINHRIAELEHEGVLEFYCLRLRDATSVAPTAADVSMMKKLQKLKEKAAKQTWSQIEGLNLFGMVQNIPTDFVLSHEEDVDLKHTVEQLLDWTPPGQPNATSLAARFVRAVGPGSDAPHSGPVARTLPGATALP